jgi:cytochrome c biogenesis protein CcdA
MISLLSILAMGFLFGMRHATDPDHVVAVSTIVSRDRSVLRAAMIGIAWGLGHTLTIVAVGFVMVFFRIALPPRLGLSMEMAVGLMLILLGLNNLRGVLRRRAEHAEAAVDNRVVVHSHAHGDHVHSHDHADAARGHETEHAVVATMDGWFNRSGIYQFLRPLIVGLVHGLAGSAAIALLVLTTISSPVWAVAYLVVFGLGTVMGMMLITLTMGSTFAYGGRRIAMVGKHFASVAGAVSVAFGLFVTYQIGFVDGLFRAQAHWIPR